MPRPKKTDKKPAEKPKAKATAKRRKDKEEDADDLEEFEEKPEKKLKVEGQKKGNGKAKVCILAYLDQTSPGNTTSGTHTFKDLASALEFRVGLIKRLEGGEYENELGVVSGIPYFNSQSKEHIYNGDCQDGSFSIIIKEITVDELLEGLDVKIWQG